MDIAEFVESKRAQAAAEADSDTYHDYVYSQGRNAIRIAFGLVAIEEAAEAKRWFSEIGPLRVDGAEFAVDHRLENRKKHAGSLPVNTWFHALASAVMCGDQSVWHETARDVHEQITAPNVQNLDGIERAGRLASYAALSGLGAGVEIAPLLETVRLRATRESESEAPYAWNGIEFNGPQADVIAGIDDVDGPTVEDGLDGLLEFHEEYRVGNEDIVEIEQAIDFHTTAYVVLARQEGLDVHVDSEYVPDAVYDGDQYPIGE